MDSLFSFPVGSFIPYNMPVYPGAVAVHQSSDSRERRASPVSVSLPIADLNSARACFRMGMSRSASFHKLRKSL